MLAQQPLATWLQGGMGLHRISVCAQQVGRQEPSKGLSPVLGHLAWKAAFLCPVWQHCPWEALWNCFSFSFSVLGMEPRASYVTGKHSATELHLSLVMGFLRGQKEKHVSGPVLERLLGCL